MTQFNFGKYFNFQGAIALVASLALLVGSVLGVNAYFAKERAFQSYVDVTDKRFVEANTKLLIYQAEQSKSYVQEKMWKVQDRVEQRPSDSVARQRLRELEAEKDRLDIRINDLKKGKN